MNWNDNTRAAFIGLVNAVVPTLVLLGVVEWTDEQVAGVMASIVAGTTFLGLLFKRGQQSGEALALGPNPTAE